MAYISRPDGSREPIKTPVSLEEAQRIVGGYVERVAPKRTPGIMFLCDEEGLIKGKPVNAHGCELYGPTSPIVGTIIVFENRREARGWL